VDAFAVGAVKQQAVHVRFYDLRQLMKSFDVEVATAVERGGKGRDNHKNGFLL
jgi:hypothetical protein